MFVTGATTTAYVVRIHRVINRKLVVPMDVTHVKDPGIVTCATTTVYVV